MTYEIGNHPVKHKVTQGIQSCIKNGEVFAIAPQVVNEFLHVVTDSRRFSYPLTMSEALERIIFWQQAKESQVVFPTERSLLQQERWMSEFHLGRKRVLDTTLAATYKEHGIRRLASASPGDFALFGVFTFENLAQ